MSKARIEEQPRHPADHQAVNATFVGLLVGWMLFISQEFLLASIISGRSPCAGLCRGCGGRRHRANRPDHRAHEPGAPRLKTAQTKPKLRKLCRFCGRCDAGAEPATGRFGENEAKAAQTLRVLWMVPPRSRPTGTVNRRSSPTARERRVLQRLAGYRRHGAEAVDVRRRRVFGFGADRHPATTPRHRRNGENEATVIGTGVVTSIEAIASSGCETLAVAR